MSRNGFNKTLQPSNWIDNASFDPPPCQNSPVCDFDTTYKKRALELVQDAKKKAKRTKPTVAVQGYIVNKETADLVATGCTILAGAGVGLLCAGLVIAGAPSYGATFAIAPVLTVALGAAIHKTKKELVYQWNSHKAKAGILGEGDDEHYNDHDPTLFVPSVIKVLKKLERVRRRVRQKGKWWNPRKYWTIARQPVTAVRAAFSRSEEIGFSGLARSDGELNRRLNELRRYGQLAYRYVSTVLEDLVLQRDVIAGGCNAIYKRILAQVHVMGRHQNCSHSSCYGMSEAEARLRAEELRRQGLTSLAEISAQDVLKLRARSAMQGGSVDEADLIAVVKAAKAAAEARSSALGGAAERDYEGFLARLAEGGKEFAEKGVEVGLEYSAEVGSHAVAVAAPALEGAAQVAGGGLAGGASAVVGVALDEILEAVSHQVTRWAVLKHKAGLFNLSDARDDAVKDLKHLIGKKNVLSRMPRVAAKCASYVDKLDAIRRKLEPLYNQVAIMGRPFASCEQAYQLAYAMSYYFRNFEKFLTFLVYLQCALLHVDDEVASMDIGVKPGEIIEV
jgi:hypothetical protein